MGRIDWNLAAGEEGEALPELGPKLEPEFRLEAEHEAEPDTQMESEAAAEAIMEPDSGEETAPEPANIAAESSAQDHVLIAIGRIVCAWGLFEGALEERIATLRTAAGEVRAVGNRTRPGIARRFAELRAVIAMRDRRNAEALNEIAQIEGEIQRIDTLRLMIVEGFHGREDDALICRDAKNRPVSVTIAQIEREATALDKLREKIAII